MRVVGYDQDKDQPLEVIKLPKVFPDIEKLNMILNTFDAYKEMIFSKYFVKYLGFNTTEDQDYNLYFMELHNELTIAELYMQTPYKLTSQMLLFKYWAREIFKGLNDLLCMCTYSFKKPIRLSHILAADFGTKVVFNNLNFTERRCKVSESQECLEASLLKNYGTLLLELLNYSTLDEMKQSEGLEQVELTTFIETLLSAKKELQRYLGRHFSPDGNTYYHMTFENTLSHPFFNQAQVIKADVLDLAEEFSRVFEPHKQEAELQAAKH